VPKETQREKDVAAYEELLDLIARAERGSSWHEAFEFLTANKKRLELLPGHWLEDALVSLEHSPLLEIQDQWRRKFIINHRLFPIALLLQNIDEAQDRFEESAWWLAGMFTSGNLSEDRWRSGMAMALVMLASTDLVLATGNNVSRADIQRATRRFDYDLAYLEKWKPEGSQASIAHRASLYAGGIRGQAFRNFEETFARQKEETVLEDQSLIDTKEHPVFQPFPFGWVAVYDAIGDNNTCGPCAAAAAQRYFLLTRGPFPGQICQGQAKCRCRRTPRYLPEEYRRLVKEDRDKPQWI
jgi:hypothetical protein